MKIAFISTYYRDEELVYLESIKKEVGNFNIPDMKWYITDCRNDNKGYASGINRGIQKALKESADLFVICNSDISVKEIPWTEIQAAQKYFDVYGFANRQDKKVYYGGRIDPWRMSGGLLEKKPAKRYVERDFVSGSFMVIKKNVIEKIGLWDESYFLYYDEVDYCYRAKKSGFRVGIDSKYSYDHFEISNTANKRKNYYLAKSRLMFFLKYANTRQKVREFFRIPKTLIEEIPSLMSYIASSNFLVNFFSLNVSSLIIKFTSFINFLFLVRFLTAAEYGIYALVWAQVTVLSPLADFGTTTYGVVYLPTEKEKTYQSLFNFRIFVSVIVFLVTLVLSVILFRGSSKIYSYVFITATVIFTNMSSGSYFILNALRNKLYRSSRNSVIFNIFLVTAIAASLVLFHRLLAVFVIIFIFYNIYSICNLLFIKREYPLFHFRFDVKEWMSILRKLYIFVLISFFAGLYSRLDVFLLKLLKGEAEVGIYSAGTKFLEALLFIAVSYNVTATPILSRLSENAEALKKRIMKDVVFLSFIGSAVVIGIVLFSPFFLTYVFKKNYMLSIPVLRIVIFALPFILLNSIWLNLLYVLKKSYLAIFIFVFQAILNLGLNLFFIPRYSYIASSYITVFSELMNCLVLIVLVRYVWQKTFPKKSYENIH